MDSMGTLIREGSNWVLIKELADISWTEQLLSETTKTDWHEYTSAKGKNSRQHYFTNPSWMPEENFQSPPSWESTAEVLRGIVQKEIVNHGVMPFKWDSMQPASGWTVIGEEGSYHTAHDHGPENISTVLYTSVPLKQEDPEGVIYFMLDGGGYSPVSKPNFRLFHVCPRVGTLVIFPSFIIHGVYPQGAGKRQTINIDFRGEAMNNKSGPTRYG